MRGTQTCALDRGDKKRTAADLPRSFDKAKFLEELVCFVVLHEVTASFEGLQVESEKVGMAGGDDVMKGGFQGFPFDTLGVFDDGAENDHVRKRGCVHIGGHAGCGDVDDLDIGALNFARDEGGVDKEEAAGGDFFFVLIQGRGVHNHKDVRVRHDGRADGVVAQDHAAVAGAAAHFGSVRREPGEFAVFDEACVREDFAREEQALAAEARHDNFLLCHFMLPPFSVRYPYL